ncbi:MAG TPA: heavy metal translocating P-type ATPase, partial [Puia sp.]|nr:heavy metal translocating P-type ATPase [Puia sp.]
MIDDFKKRFFVVLVFTIPIMFLSETIQHWINIHIHFTGDHFVLLLFSSVVFFYGGWPFLKGAWSEMKVKNPGMMTLIG